MFGQDSVAKAILLERKKTPLASRVLLPQGLETSVVNWTAAPERATWYGVKRRLQGGPLLTVPVEPWVIRDEGGVALDLAARYPRLLTFQEGGLGDEDLRDLATVQQELKNRLTRRDLMAPVIKLYRDMALRPLIDKEIAGAIWFRVPDWKKTRVLSFQDIPAAAMEGEIVFDMNEIWSSIEQRLARVSARRSSNVIQLQVDWPAFPLIVRRSAPGIMMQAFQKWVVWRMLDSSGKMFREFWKASGLKLKQEALDLLEKASRENKIVVQLNGNMTRIEVTGDRGLLFKLMPAAAAAALVGASVSAIRRARSVK